MGDVTRIPDEGFEGETALAEAAAGEFRAIIGLVRDAVAKALGSEFSPEGRPYVPLEAIYADRVVVERDGRLFAYPYTLTEDNQVELGTPEEVVTDHKPVQLREAQGAFLEASAPVAGAAPRFKIRVIRAGMSRNRVFYPDAVLREAVPLFDGARVFVKSDAEHLASQGKSFERLIGRVSEPRFVEGTSPDTGEVQGTFDVLASAGETAAKLREALERGMTDLFGFSIDATGRVRRSRGHRVATALTRVNSVDLIIEAGAGGQLISLIEALNPEEQRDMRLRERMIEAVTKANGGTLPEGLDPDDDEALETAFREAVSKQDPRPAEGASADAGSGGDASAPGAVTAAELEERVRLAEARAYARTAITASTLPDVAKARLRKRFEAEVSFTEAVVDQAIAEERAYLGAVGGGAHVTGLGDASLIEAGEQQADKIAKMLDAFFDKENRDVISFKECYIAVTGDRRVTGHLRHCDRARLREALGAEFREALDSTSFSNVLGDSITRRMIADYNQPSRYGVWRRLADVTPVTDFRTQERTRYGGYGDLPTVAEKAPYSALSSPTDEKATYAVTKRGGTETVTIEMIKNDDVGAIQRIPVKLSRAAQRTLSKFVMDFIKDNPTIYDSVALFHANHGNLGSAALDATALAAARLAVLKQTELNSADRIGVPPVNLWVPFDLEEAAFNLFRRQTNNDTDFVESLQMTVVPVWYWTDSNDWAVSCDFNEVPTIEVGFLDGNQEPELFVQDSPTQGSLFSNDQITYKIRHIYGGNVLDYRGMYKAVVA